MTGAAPLPYPALVTRASTSWLLLAQAGPGAVLDVAGRWGAMVMVASAIVYGMVLLMGSRRAPRARRRGRRVDMATAATLATPEIVVLMPCLNEATVIRASVERLLSIPAQGLGIMVIDDGSEDGTAEVVEGIGDPRARVMRRVLPEARQGKGEALNMALEVIRSELDHRRPQDVVVGVVDADGRLDPEAIALARLAFSDPQVGAVQMGVRINNRFHSLLARMQDMEFVVFTEVFQRGRRHLGSVGMGGNAQFVRLAALDALGERPWSRSLTEDFDLGIRLNGTRWTNEFCPEASVHQQGVTSMKRLLRQRARWFQGNLQALPLVPHVLRTLRGPVRWDTLYQVLTPYMLLAASLLTASFLMVLVVAVVTALSGASQPWGWLVVAYLLAFGPGMAYGAVYWSVERSEGFGVLRAVGCAHLFVLYGMLAYLSGWRAVGRALTGRTGWAKTAREVEPATGAGAGAGAGCAVEPDGVPDPPPGATAGEPA